MSQAERKRGPHLQLALKPSPLLKKSPQFLGILLGELAQLILLLRCIDSRRRFAGSHRKGSSGCGSRYQEPEMKHEIHVIIVGCTATIRICCDLRSEATRLNILKHDHVADCHVIFKSTLHAIEKQILSLWEPGFWITSHRRARQRRQSIQ